MEKKDKIQLVITGILIIVLIVILASGLGKNRKKKRKSRSASRPAASAQTSISSSPTPPSAFHDLQDKAQDIELVRDPFTLKKIEAEEEDPEGGKSVKLILVGISWDPEYPKAIINGKIVQKGSQLDRYTVIDVLRDRVLLSDGTEKIELMLDL